MTDSGSRSFAMTLYKAVCECNLQTCLLLSQAQPGPTDVAVAVVECMVLHNPERFGCMG